MQKLNKVTYIKALKTDRIVVATFFVNNIYDHLAGREVVDSFFPLRYKNKQGNS